MYKETIPLWEEVETDKYQIDAKARVAQVELDYADVYRAQDVIRVKVHPQLNQKLIRSLIVGDKVYLDKENFIVGRQVRQNKITRMRGDETRKGKLGKQEHLFAVNVDYALIVATVDQPKFHAGLTERYLATAYYNDVTPIIIINKCDIADLDASIITYYSNALGIKVIYTSTITKQGVVELKNEIKNNVCVFLGNSGVGKSSLINALKDVEELKTGDVNKKTGEGRHTTTRSSMYKLFDDTYVIDTPGIRNLDISNIDNKDLAFCYPDFEKYIGECKFIDCTHTNEIDCAIKDAVSKGFIHEERYASYLGVYQ
ncbi:ribosome small subunit-dependent GTPase A, partial [candidate division WWE3 bacterium]|nr:ribosome small subunit-dependent GTPase A [candidate division WWE3 bacterium]